MNILKETRLKHNMTQKDAALLLGVSSRTYQRYEESNSLSKKLENLCVVIDNNFLIDETHGVLTKQNISKLIEPVLTEYNISLCFLFGSYAKGTAKPTSDVDLLVDSNVEGLDFFVLVDKLRVALGKKVDVILLNQLTSSKELMETILREGIKLRG